MKQAKNLFKILIMCLMIFGLANNTVFAATCGTANGSSFYTAPTENLCSAGIPSSVTGTGELSALDAENPTLTATNIDTQFKSRLIITGSECGGEGGEISGAAPLPKWKEINP